MNSADLFNPELLSVVDLTVLELEKRLFRCYAQAGPEDSASSYDRFEVERGLEELRHLIASVKRRHVGLVLVGDAGITSRFGDCSAEQRFRLG